MLFPSEAAVARQAKLQAFSTSSGSRDSRPVHGKPTQSQNAAAGMQGELVCITTVQPNPYDTVCVHESVTSELAYQSSVQENITEFL
jgi:hypothetical protein